MIPLLYFKKQKKNPRNLLSVNTDLYEHLWSGWEYIFQMAAEIILEAGLLW